MCVLECTHVIALVYKFYKELSNRAGCWVSMHVAQVKMDSLVLSDCTLALDSWWGSAAECTVEIKICFNSHDIVLNMTNYYYLIACFIKRLLIL